MSHLAKFRLYSTSLFMLSRPWIVFASGGLVLLSYLIASRGNVEWPVAMLALLGTSLLAAGGAAINDFFDYDIDVAAHPARALPRRRIRRQTALIYALLLFAVSATLFLFVNLPTFSVALFWIALFFCYSFVKKVSGIAANCITGLLTGTLVVSGILVSANASQHAVPLTVVGVCAFLATVAREIAKDVEDAKADIGHRITLPVQFGTKPSYLVSALCLALAVMLSYVPHVLGLMPAPYVYLVTGANALAVHAVLRMTRWKPEDAPIIVRLIKIAMLSYLAILAGITLMGP